jgi:hypothetical protein
MSNVKKSNNNANRSYTANGESTWNTDAYQSSSHQQNQTNRSRHSKYYQGKNNGSPNNKYYSAKTGNRDLEVSYQHTTEIELIVQNKQENSSNLDNSPAFSPSSESNSSETPEEPDQVKTTEAYNGGGYDQGLTMSQTEVNNSSVCYNNNNAYNEYDYQQTSVQQQSQYYMYQPSYQEYNQCQNISGSPLNSSFTHPQAYYPTYQPLPSYIYDTQAYSQAYSPIQSTMQQTFNHTPGNNQQINQTANLSSPQPPQQPNFMASYQTPPQPSHQLYIQTSNITPPTSLSPNDTPSTNNPMPSSTSTERSTDCQSPSPCQNMSQASSNLAQTPVHNPYIMQYSQELMQGQYGHMTPNYTPLTPGQAYQCNSPLPTAQYMMYNPPPMLQQGCGSPYSQTGLNSPMMHTPYGSNNGQTPSKFQGNHKHNRNNNKFNNKRGGFNNTQKYSYPEQTPQLSYSHEESQFMNSPVMPTMPTFEQNI